MSKQTSCNLCGKSFVCDNGMWSATCTCAQDRPKELEHANKPRSFAMVPYYFFHVVPRLLPVAKRLGYAIALHGSFQRDLDVVAVPWTDEAVSAEELAEALRVEVHGWLCNDKDQNPRAKPHGRLCWSIHTEDGVGYIDLSVVPRASMQIGNIGMKFMSNGNIWIERESGEGAEFPIAAMEKALASFYDASF